MENRKVLLDTSFLISLAQEERPNHKNATEYFKYLLENGYTLILSSIVVAEFETKQQIPDSFLKHFQLCNFTFIDGRKAGELTTTPLRSDGDSNSRDAIKDDYKLLAQIINNDIGYIATEDSQAIKKIYDPRIEALGLHFRCIDISTNYKAFFEVPPTLFD